MEGKGPLCLAVLGPGPWEDVTQGPWKEMRNTRVYTQVTALPDERLARSSRDTEQRPRHVSRRPAEGDQRQDGCLLHSTVMRVCWLSVGSGDGTQVQCTHWCCSASAPSPLMPAC